MASRRPRTTPSQAEAASTPPQADATSTSTEPKLPAPQYILVLASCLPSFFASLSIDSGTDFNMFDSFAGVL
jgi:hypothetical protein